MIINNAHSDCNQAPCQRLKTSWLGCGWPNLWNRPCRNIDAFGREGRYYSSLAEGVYSRGCS